MLADAGLPDEIRSVLERVQNELFDLGADLSVPFGVTDRLRITSEQIAGLEEDCDRFNAELPDLKSFVLPGGTEAAARLGVSPRGCTAIEDSHNGILAAAAAGMRVIAIPNREFPPGDEALAAADVVLDSLAELTPDVVDPPG